MTLPGCRRFLLCTYACQIESRSTPIEVLLLIPFHDTELCLQAEVTYSPLRLFAGFRIPLLPGFHWGLHRATILHSMTLEQLLNVRTLCDTDGVPCHIPNCLYYQKSRWRSQIVRFELSPILHLKLPTASCIPPMSPLQAPSLPMSRFTFRAFDPFSCTALISAASEALKDSVLRLVAAPALGHEKNTFAKIIPGRCSQPPPNGGVQPFENGFFPPAKEVWAASCAGRWAPSRGKR